MKKHIFSSLLVVSFFLTGDSVKGQLNYLASGSSNTLGSYNDLGSNGTTIITSNFDDDNSAPQNIGFNFNYNGTAFTQFVLNTNGFIKLGNTNPSAPDLFYTTGNGNTGGIFNSALPADSNIISIFNHDLQAGTGTPEYRVFTSGTTGSRVCTIQFKNLREKTTSPAIQYDNIEFQIKLYETTNAIEFIYGTWTASANSSATKSAAVGLKGKDNTNPELLVVNHVSLQTWDIAGITAGNYTGINAFKFGNPPNRPAPDPGRTIRFVQAFPKDAIVNLFTLGNIPIPYGTPHTDSAIVRNFGMDTLKNISVTLNISGANTFTDTKNISLLAPGAYSTVGFTPYTLTNTGTNTVTASLSSDDNLNNNSDSYSQNANYTVFSYADSGPATDGLGGQLPSYIVTKYTITGSTTVTGANIFLANNATAIGKTVYAILFDNMGIKLDSSAALIISAADTGKYYNFSFPKTPAISNSSFYVGLAQPTTAMNYYPLGYQLEKAPVRKGAYFVTTNLGTPSFFDQGGVNSFNTYRFMIQAVIANSTGTIENTITSEITAYPNPSSNTVTFNIQGNHKDILFNLFDVTGKTVKTVDHINSAELKLEPEDLESGIYFYSFSNSEEIIGTGKLIIE